MHSYTRKINITFYTLELNATNICSIRYSFFFLSFACYGTLRGEKTQKKGTGGMIYRARALNRTVIMTTMVTTVTMVAIVITVTMVTVVITVTMVTVLTRVTMVTILTTVTMVITLTTVKLVTT